MQTVIDTDWHRRPSANFHGTDLQVMFGNRAADRRFSHLYIPTPEAKEWDGCQDATHAIGSRHGGYCYVKLEITGRKVRQPWGPSSVGGITDPCLKARLTIGLNTGEPADVETVDAYLIGDEATLTAMLERR